MISFRSLNTIQNKRFFTPRSEGFFIVKTFNREGRKGRGKKDETLPKVKLVHLRRKPSEV